MNKNDFNSFVTLKGEFFMILLGDLLMYLQTKQGNNFFNGIPKKSGIYKVYVNDSDKDNIVFNVPRDIYGNQLHLKKVRSSQELADIYAGNLAKDSVGKHYLYIGKATNLNKRIRQYMRTVFGGKSHMGGVDIWAIKNYSHYLYVEWYELSSTNYLTAREWEETEIAKFKKEHDNRRPVANRCD